MKSLPIPPAAETDPKAIEVLRVWIAHKNQHVSLETGIWKDPAAWGIMLVDLAKHVANAYEQSSGESAQQILMRVKEAFDAEWDHSTDNPTGFLANN